MGNDKGKKEELLDSFVSVSQRIGNHIYLRSLRDSFATIMPLFILASLAILVNAVFLDPSGFMSSIINESTMVTWQNLGNIITNATLNIAGLLLALSMGYHLAKNKDYDNPIGVAIAVAPAFLTLLPLMVSLTPNGSDNAISFDGIISYAQIGSKGIFAAIITGILATELYIWLTKSDKMKIKLGENVPPAVGKSFNTMIPLILTVSLFAFASFLVQLTGNDFMSLIERFIQEPLRGVVTSLPGYLLLVTLGKSIVWIRYSPICCNWSYIGSTTIG